MAEKPKASNSLAQRELDKAEEQFEKFDQEIKGMTLERMNQAPKKELEHNLSQKEIENSKDIYLKPTRTLSSREKFNEEYRKDYEFAREYVRCIPKNIEIIGENITVWTKPFPGMNAEMWEVPTDKPIWCPRYLAEQLHNCKYHRFVMQDLVTSGDNQGNKYYGTMAVDTTVQRLDALPVSTKKSVFMGVSGF